MSLSIVQHGDYDIFICKGDMKVNLLPHLSPQLSKYIQACPDKDLILDLSAVDFIDSSTIRMFVNLHKRLQPAGKRLCLLALSPGVARILEDVKLSSVFSMFAGITDLERAMHGRRFDAYAACTTPDQGLKRLSGSCPVCGSTDIRGYLIDVSDYQWEWHGDDPFPVSSSPRGADAPDILGLLPLVCSSCYMCSLDYSHFNGQRADGSVVAAVLSAEAIRQLSKTTKARKKLMESCVGIGDRLFFHPRDKAACYFLYQLSESCMRSLAASHQTDASFFMGYINYIAMKYAPSEKREEHLGNLRTWLSQVLSDKPRYGSLSLAQAYYAMFLAAVTLGRQKEAEKLFEDFSDLVKSMPDDGKATIASPRFWFARANKIIEKGLPPTGG